MPNKLGETAPQKPKIKEFLAKNIPFLQAVNWNPFSKKVPYKSQAPQGGGLAKLRQRGC